ncbi:hypothetical protein LX16_3913 [Stackebrandtia albiflava]|uniref:Uncharacterized protein n=1 Tax=Stackebrandtia albiflava TaxID=406432 RepID=A0A562UY17_9ACTN|nr:hypothetical protein [Stackebrandtia albiflava]TWJ10496.1 hypothetical protein LX16_3913 [Stackebrandtia albiflava]
MRDQRPIDPFAPHDGSDDTQEHPIVPVAPRSPAPERIRGFWDPPSTTVPDPSPPEEPTAEPTPPPEPVFTTTPPGPVEDDPDHTRELPIVTATPPKPSRPRPRWLIPAALVLLVAAVTGGLVGLSAMGTPAPAAEPGPVATETPDSSPASGKPVPAGSTAEPTPPEGEDTPSSSAPESEVPEDDAGEPDDSAPESVTVPSHPTLFGAWWAGDGRYAAKWETPADDGGADILGYLVTDCSGNHLAGVDSYTFDVEVYRDSLDCMSVQAFNVAGLGQTAVFWIQR